MIYWTCPDVDKQHLTEREVIKHMRARKPVKQTETRRLVDTAGLQEYLSSGRSNAVRFGTEANARVRIGRSVLWDLNKIDRHIESVTE